LAQEVEGCGLIAMRRDITSVASAAKKAMHQHHSEMIGLEIVGGCFDWWGGSNGYERPKRSRGGVRFIHPVIRACL